MSVSTIHPTTFSHTLHPVSPSIRSFPSSFPLYSDPFLRSLIVCTIVISLISLPYSLLNVIFPLPSYFLNVSLSLFLFFFPSDLFIRSPPKSLPSPLPPSLPSAWQSRLFCAASLPMRRCFQPTADSQKEV